ncbi:MAG TPA: choice-of-anchor tandem repeat GloVer-containing protein, partial [Rhizomicrobium sp.]|nr:choice-of-anchor tandem repeat GloVer-containing protein [Rhizomicrobium sp.]
MRQRHVWFGAALVLAASAVPALATPQFKILATVPAGCPAVGAVHGGVIYGTQNSCGSSSGYIFAFNIVTRQFSDIHDFNVSLEGSRPNPGLAVDASGNLFGTAAIGGNTNNGTIFKLDTN